MASSERVQNLFAGASELAPDRRAAYLDEACGGDDALRAKVETLLRSHDEASRFLSSPTGEAPTLSVVSAAATAAAPVGEHAGMRIGPYKLLQMIGEGGFGSVFMAEQERPVIRKVALKIIKLGMDTRAVIARFEAERQALAMMDHPNIAKVLDAGATETGRPYFVMELCKGEAIVEFCDRNNLSVAERLDLFAQVCAAVQHAHNKGIIHRDIKPSNVLVSMQDGHPHAKVIDFGIAKATASRLTEKTLFTEHRALIGTPEYMSPEQAEGSLDIDTRTDVYSLGVLLYELLTGTTPFSSKELRSAAYAEIQRIIREVEPPRPSTRLSANTDTLPSVAANRHTEPKRLGTIVRGELDWIVMKALEKDRQRRYETTNALAMDIRRYLAGETVLAAPPGRSYRVRKFVRRNKGAVTAAVVVAAALVLGMAGTSLALKRALDAESGLSEQLAKTERAQQAEKERADQLKRVSDFQARMLGRINTTTAGESLMQDVRERFAAVLEKAGVPEAERAAQARALGDLLARINATDTAAAMIDRTILRPAIRAIDEQFKDDPRTDASLRQSLATLYLSIGLYEAALPLQESALATRRRVLGEEHTDTLASVGNMGTLLASQGRLEQAEPYVREVLEKSRGVLGEDHPQTLAALDNMGNLLRDQGKLAESEPYQREALDKSRRLMGEEHQSTLRALNNLALLLMAQGKPADAEPYLRELLEKCRRVLGEDHWGTLTALNNMGVLLHGQGKFEQAEPFWRETMEKRRRVLGEDHPDTLSAIHNMGILLLARGKLAEAEPFLREGLEKHRRVLGADHPSTLTSIGSMAGLLHAQDKPEEAEPYWREAMEGSRRVLGADHPHTLVYISNTGSVLLQRGRPRDALDLLAPVEAASRRAFSDGHPLHLAAYLTALGGARAALGHNADALSLAESNLLEAHPIFVRTQGSGHKDTRTCVRRLVDLYTAWHAADPGKGYDAKAKEWEERLELPAAKDEE
ncbi:MAG: serine/threonine protein kinase [Phycisphaeraceae bacterium]|nr:serine/threonine protein kinase [Phycisphaeraceae bacterium]